MITGAVITIAVLLFVFQCWIEYNARQRDHEIICLVRRIDKLLRIWAQHWGEDQDKVKSMLLTEVKHGIEYDRRRFERRSSWTSPYAPGGF